MTILQGAVFGVLIAIGGCFASILMWPYLNMIAETFIDFGLEPMQAIVATVLILTCIVMSPMPFIWKRA